MRKLLIVVDYQVDFVSGALGFSGAETLEGKILAKLDAALAAGDDVLFTLDTHGPDYLETQEGRRLPVAHCVKGTPGHRLFGRVESYRDKGVCLEKPTFGSAELLDLLRGKDYAHIELVGLVSNICVLSNAVICKTALPEAEIVIDAACTASFDDALGQKALDVAEGIQVTVINRP